MSDVFSVVGPVLFKRGPSVDYAVEVLKNGGLGTRHLLTGRVVPHVLSKAPPQTPDWCGFGRIEGVSGERPAELPRIRDLGSTPSGTKPACISCAPLPPLHGNGLTEA